MNGVPGWIPPTMAISLVVIALSFLMMGGGALLAVLVIRRKIKDLQGQLTRVTDDTKIIVNRLKGELTGYADLSTETRLKIQRAVDTASGRLQDLDALVEVLQAEAEDTALDAAAFLRTVRGSKRILGAALRRRGRG